MVFDNLRQFSNVDDQCPSTIFATKIIFLSPAPEEGAGIKCMLITRLYLMPNLNFKAPSRVRVKRDHSTWDKSADLASSYCMFRESFRRPPLFLDFYDLGSVSQVCRGGNYPERLVHENFLSWRGELKPESRARKRWRGEGGKELVLHFLRESLSL